MSKDNAENEEILDEGTEEGQESPEQVQDASTAESAVKSSKDEPLFSRNRWGVGSKLGSTLKHKKAKK